MAKYETFYLRPTGWEGEPEEEIIKLSTIDPTPNCAYNHYVVFFRLDDAAKGQAVESLKVALERTLSQARYLCGIIEKDPEGGLSFVKKRDTTVNLVVQHLDSPDDVDRNPSLEDIEKAHFSCKSLGGLELWGIPEMLWGDGNPAADIDNSPTTAAYQINFVRGSLVFTCIDASRFTRHIPKGSLVDGPPQAQRHPGHPAGQQACLFHLPMSKAAHLKQLATPSNPTQWISTYDAMCAYLWRQVSKIRAPLHKPDPSAHGYFGEAVNMRPRICDPLPPRMMRNVVCGTFGDSAPVTPRPTFSDIISEAPLSELALYIRRLTNSCTEEHMNALMDMITPIKNKRSISLRVDALPPMAIWVTDHRPADVGGFDFGFANPITHRHMWVDEVSPGLVLIYAPIMSSKNPDEGCTFTDTLEAELVSQLLEDRNGTSSLSIGALTESGGGGIEDILV